MVIPCGPALKIGAEFFTRADGSPWAGIASPDQGACDQPVSTVKEDSDTVELDLNVATLKLTWVKTISKESFPRAAACSRSR